MHLREALAGFPFLCTRQGAPAQVAHDTAQVLRGDEGVLSALAKCGPWLNPQGRRTSWPNGFWHERSNGEASVRLSRHQPIASLTGLPTRLSISTSVSMVNLAVFLLTTSDKRL